jgi:hypothetical protein
MWHADMLRVLRYACCAMQVRAMQIIDELEVHRRGPYGGGVGHVSFTGALPRQPAWGPCAASALQACSRCRKMFLILEHYIQAASG